jgi:hypothetical protein
LNIENVSSLLAEVAERCVLNAAPQVATRNGLSRRSKLPEAVEDIAVFGSED